MDNAAERGNIMSRWPVTNSNDPSTIFQKRIMDGVSSQPSVDNDPRVINRPACRSHQRQNLRYRTKLTLNTSKPDHYAASNVVSLRHRTSVACSNSIVLALACYTTNFFPHGVRVHGHHCLAVQPSPTCHRTVKMIREYIYMTNR